MPNYVKYDGNDLRYKNAKVTTDENVIADGAYNAPPSLITFKINNTEYSAEENMTFGEWVDSAYNTGDFVAYDDSVFTSDESFYLENITLADTIYAGGEYSLVQY